VASRLIHGSVRMLISARRRDLLHGIDKSIQILDVEPLSDTAAGLLLDAQPKQPDRGIRGEIIRWSAGNPLALIESARYYGSTGASTFQSNRMVGADGVLSL